MVLDLIDDRFRRRGGGEACRGLRVGHRLSRSSLLTYRQSGRKLQLLFTVFEINQQVFDVLVTIFTVLAQTLADDLF